MKWFDRTWLVVVIILLAVVMLLQPGWLLSVLGIIQSIVFIALGIVATAYLWKRL
jgi:hypothetical protein